MVGIAMASAANRGSKRFSIKLSPFRFADSRITYFSDVRRFLLIFLLLVLPCQFAWSAAVPYCQHEAQPAKSWHLGHHEHRHEAKKQHETKMAVDADCDVCHLASAPLASVARTFVSIHQQVPADVQSVERKLHSHVPEAPDRPNWSRLA